MRFLAFMYPQIYSAPDISVMTTARLMSACAIQRYSVLINRKYEIRAATCRVVLSLPLQPPAMTVPALAAYMRSELTTNSRSSVAAMAINMNSLPSSASICRKPSIANTVSSLSAIGSINLPKSVTSSYLRAIYPSIRSVILASTNNSPGTSRNNSLLSGGTVSIVTSTAQAARIRIMENLK